MTDEVEKYVNDCMDWNDSIENDGNELTTVEEGDYTFRISGFERARYVGSAKIPACNKASITVDILTKDGTPAICKFDLILYRSLEWKLSAFFRSIGQKKHGEKLTMDWSKVLNSYGRAHFKPRTYTNNNGEEKTVNDLDKFLDYDEEAINADKEAFMNSQDLPF